MSQVTSSDHWELIVFFLTFQPTDVSILIKLRFDHLSYQDVLTFVAHRIWLPSNIVSAIRASVTTRAGRAATTSDTCEPSSSNPCLHGCLYSQITMDYIKYHILNISILFNIYFLYVHNLHYVCVHHMYNYMCVHSVHIYTYTYQCPTPADSIHIQSFNQFPFTWALQVMKVGGKGILEWQEMTVEKGKSQANYVNLGLTRSSKIMIFGNLVGSVSVSLNWMRMFTERTHVLYRFSVIMCINGTSSAVKSHHTTRNRGETSCTTPIKWIKCYKKVLWWWAVLPPDPWFAVLSWSLHQGMSKQRCPWGWEGTDVDGGNLNVCFFTVRRSLLEWFQLLLAGHALRVSLSHTHTHTEQRFLSPYTPRCVQNAKDPHLNHRILQNTARRYWNISKLCYILGGLFRQFLILFDWFM